EHLNQRHLLTHKHDRCNENGDYFQVSSCKSRSDGRVLEHRHISDKCTQIGSNRKVYPLLGQKPANPGNGQCCRCCIVCGNLETDLRKGIEDHQNDKANNVELLHAVQPTKITPNVINEIAVIRLGVSFSLKNILPQIITHKMLKLPKSTAT